MRVFQPVISFLLFSNFVLLLVENGSESESESVDWFLNIDIDRHRYDAIAPAKTYVCRITNIDNFY